MKKLTLLSGALALAFVVGCGTTPGIGTPGPGGGTPPVDLDAARAALCDTTNDASLANLATELETLGADADVTQVDAAISTAITNLQATDVDATEQLAREAAVSALSALQGVLGDPQARTAAAAEAANALRAADTELC